MIVGAESRPVVYPSTAIEFATSNAGHLSLRGSPYVLVCANMGCPTLCWFSIKALPVVSDLQADL